MPDLQHLWQRFLLAAALVAGLAIGVGATIFGYSNLDTVDIHWSVLHFDGIPLWAVVIVPIALILVSGTIFHWLDSLHHFTEHMRHRRRVHELEAEVSRLRAHLDQVLEMPPGEALKTEPEKASLPQADVADVAAIDAEMPAAESEPAADAKPAKASKTKRAKLLPEPAEAPAPAENGAAESEEMATAATATATNDAG
ncbi:MAG TPA: hypothetical protein VFL29_00440 [Candidatus Dormibacteraeota bacterium]|nr:hypothetical protein [Candidatus Dormibacteraeota bacterium]